jgi:hypothetical protein
MARMNSRVPLASTCLLALLLLPATRCASAAEAAGSGAAPPAAFKWCDTAPRLADRLMILDLVGMAAWLRAQGVESSGPTPAEETVSAVATALRAKHRDVLTDRLRTAIRETLSAPAGTDTPAKRLLDLVDVVETALR